MIEVTCKPFTTVRVMAFNDEQTEIRIRYGGGPNPTSLLALLDRTQSLQLANELTGHALEELIQAARESLKPEKITPEELRPKLERLAHAVGAFK